MSREINDRMKEALDTATELVLGDRQKDYGTPEESFGLIAKFWGAYLGIEISAEKAAIMMALLKIARSANGRKTTDTYYDMIGYAAIAYALRDIPAEDGTVNSENSQLIFKAEPVRESEATFSSEEVTVSEFRKWLVGVPAHAPSTEQLSLAYRAGYAIARRNPPEGWQLVPKEPTKEMQEAYRFFMEVSDTKYFHEIYRAIMNSAPNYPYTAQDVVGSDFNKARE